MRLRRLSVPILAAIILCSASHANGHAIVLSATPGPNEVVSGPEVPVKLQFNSRIDAKRSRLLLVAPDGKQQVLTVGETASGDSLISEAKRLTSGSYLLRWQVLASDGHITRGELPFRVR